jgi:hypothetical protein
MSSIQHRKMVNHDYQTEMVLFSSTESRHAAAADAGSST